MYAGIKRRCSTDLVHPVCTIIIGAGVQGEDNGNNRSWGGGGGLRVQ